MQACPDFQTRLFHQQALTLGQLRRQSFGSVGVGGNPVVGVLQSGPSRFPLTLPPQNSINVSSLEQQNWNMNLNRVAGFIQNYGNYARQPVSVAASNMMQSNLLQAHQWQLQQLLARTHNEQNGGQQQSRLGALLTHGVGIQQQSQPQQQQQEQEQGQQLDESVARVSPVAESDTDDENSPCSRRVSMELSVENSKEADIEQQNQQLPFEQQTAKKLAAMETMAKELEDATVELQVLRTKLVSINQTIDHKQSTAEAQRRQQKLNNENKATIAELQATLASANEKAKDREVEHAAALEHAVQTRTRQHQAEMMEMERKHSLEYKQLHMMRLSEGQSARFRMEGLAQTIQDLSKDNQEKDEQLDQLRSELGKRTTRQSEAAKAKSSFSLRNKRRKR